MFQVADGEGFEDEDEDSVDGDEETDDEGETEESDGNSDDGREDKGVDLKVPMLDSDSSTDSDEEVRLVLSSLYFYTFFCTFFVCLHLKNMWMPS